MAKGSRKDEKLTPAEAGVLVKLLWNAPLPQDGYALALQAIQKLNRMAEVQPCS